MSFWRDERYKSFESSTRTGDPLRGLMAQNFPWRLLSIERTDAAGDCWKLELLCTNLEAEKSGNVVLASLSARACCTMTPERVQAMGYDPSRLAWLGLKSEAIIDEHFELQLRTKVENLTMLAKANLEKFRRFIFERFNEQNKIEAIRSRIDSRPPSRFSESN